MGVLMIERQPDIAHADEQDLRRRIAELDAALAGIETDLSAAEAERDAAESLAGSIRARGGSAASLWKAEEAYDAAVARINDLVARRRPTAEQRGRLSAYLAPIDRKRRDVEEARLALAGWETLVEVLPLLDQVAEVVDRARERACGSGFRVPPSLEQLVRQFGPGGSGMSRVRFEYTLRTTAASLRGQVEQLEREAL